MEKIETLEDYKREYFKLKRCDHGKAIFEDGEEKEFGFIFPTFEEIKGQTLYEYLKWYASKYFKTKKPIKKIYLSA